MWIGWGKQLMPTEFWWGNLFGSTKIGDQETDVRITLRRIWMK
jgi:hypothetical protein